MEESNSDKPYKAIENLKAERHAAQASSSTNQAQAILASIEQIPPSNQFPSPETITDRPAEDKEKYTVKLDGMFEGPLDLLLYLIKREEVNIWDIPIARITEQYLEYIQIMRDLSITVAGEFLVMAATLIYIKSKMLLPPDPTKPEEELEIEDPRRELVYQLLEHQKFKNAAQMLYAKEEVELEVWNKPPREFLEKGEEVIAATLFDLVVTFRDVVKRFADRVILEYEREEITLEDKMAEIRSLLLVRETIKFSTLFERAYSRQHLVVTFFALLELVRLSEVKALQEQLFGEILILKN